MSLVFERDANCVDTSWAALEIYRRNVARNAAVVVWDSIPVSQELSINTIPEEAETPWV